jgi:hypothetical protein
MPLLTVDGRSTQVVEAAQRFEIDHVTNPDARQIGMSFARLAQEMILRIRRDEDGLLLTLDKLLQAREEAMVAIAPDVRKEQARAAATPGTPRTRKPAARSKVSGAN